MKSDGNTSGCSCNARFGAVALATLHGELRDERPIMGVVLTRGLAAAVLATLPLQYGLLCSDLYINLTVVIVIFTAVNCNYRHLHYAEKRQALREAEASMHSTRRR